MGRPDRCIGHFFILHCLFVIRHSPDSFVTELANGCTKHWELIVTGRDIALATLMRQEVDEPCINYSWMTSASYMSRVAGYDYWSDREGVFYEYLRLTGINLVPQNYIPGEDQRNIERGNLAHEPRPGGSQDMSNPEDVVRWIDRLPDDAEVERQFDIRQAAREYAESIWRRTDRAEGQVLFIDSFGQADFMGGYSRWGYENYLIALVDHPEALQRYYHHSALQGRLRNIAIAIACEKYGLAPFVYTGQDICTSKGPIVSPDLLREHYFPELNWCVEPLHEAGIGIIWHCDGDIRPILQDIMDLGVIGLQGFEEEHGVRYEDIVKLTDPDGHPISVWGCVSVISTLPHGTVQDVERAVERSFELAGKGRGFVLSSTSSVMPEVPHENIDTLFHHGQAFGRRFLAS